MSAIALTREVRALAILEGWARFGKIDLRRVVGAATGGSIWRLLQQSRGVTVDRLNYHTITIGRRGSISGAAVGRGAQAIVLTNQNGAVLELSGEQDGLIVSLDLSGLALSLK